MCSSCKHGRFRERLVYELPPTLVDELENAVDVRERAEANVNDSESEMLPQQAEDELEAANEDSDENEEDEDSFLQGGAGPHTGQILTLT